MPSFLISLGVMIGLLVGNAAAFSSLTAPAFHRRSLALASTGKGFGSSSPESPSKKKSETATKELAQTAASAPAEPSNAGQKALQEMRRQRAEKKDEELRKVRELLSADQQLQETPAAIPEKVAQRMGQRMLPFVGVPLFLGMGTFVAFWYLATYKDMEFQPSVVAATTILILVVGLLGITYSLMSASWDPDREGDLLGTDELKQNVKNVQEGLSRSRENALLRERMEGLSEDELKRALSDLERREAAEEKRKKSLENKLKDELE